MIPVKLAVRNFMPYRDNVPPLYFTGIHTVSICGDNGNGKSALTDAITWALWGKTRAKSDDDLIHQGQTEMEVEFDFAVGQQMYRVIRKHAKPKRRRASGHTILEFQIATGNGFKSITGNSIRQTQQEIVKVLHMDYDTFINSAFLRQGHADEFTIADPAGRKKVLANILRLSLYDELEEKAKELAKQEETEKTLAEGILREISLELAKKPEYEAELAQALSNLSRVDTEIRQAKEQLDKLRQKRELLKTKQEQLAQLEKHLADTTRNLEHWHNQAQQLRSRIKEYEELIARRSTIEEGYAQFVKVRKLCDELEVKFRQSVSLERQKSQLESKIGEAGHSLLIEHAVTQSRIEELEVRSQKLPRLKSELQQFQTELGRLASEEEILRQKKQTSQQLLAYIHSLQASQARLEKEIEETKEKLRLLLSEGGQCPLCETELGVEGLKRIEQKYILNKQDKFDSLQANQNELAQKNLELRSIEDGISQMETRLSRERTRLQSKASVTNQEIVETEKASSQLNEEGKRLAEIEERLAKRDFARSEQEALRQLEEELAKIDYEPGQHEEARQRLTALEQYESPKRQMEEADRLINQEKEAVARVEQAIRELCSSLEADNQKREVLTLELSSLPQLTNELAQAEAEYQKLSGEQKQAQETVGNVKGKLQRCTELEIKQQEKERVLSQATSEEKIYRDLAQAFGKKGVQALLIEMALPEIEAEANKLLGRMTDNRMHVKIEPQRETKKGDVTETLDIKIADDLGTRNYEMFSGGEAFRINFAIRIALSKLLARRAGAPLPTLIIDEGFGTQDSSGLEKLKEAITSIQHDFEKIIVITHIEDLRDAFPARIDVIKTAQGSTIEVS